MAVKRLTLDQISNFPIKTLASLKGAELRKVVADATRIANQRLRRLMQKGYSEESGAYMSAVRHGHERFTTRGKKDAALRNEFQEVRRFLEMETSTVTGFRAVKKRAYSALGISGFKNLERERAFWRAARIIESLGRPNKYEAMKYLYQSMEEDKTSEIIEEINAHNAQRFGYDPAAIQYFNENSMLIDDQGKIVELTFEDQDDEIYLASQRAIIAYEEQEGSSPFVSWNDTSDYRSI